MPEAIADTSPLQYLFQTGHLNLLPLFYSRVMVPTQVLDELLAGLATGAMVPDPTGLTWVRIEEPPDDPTLPAALGPGERGVIALAAGHPATILLIDDGPARRCARRLGLRVTGTLGILLRAKREGHVEAIRPTLDALETLRFRIDVQTRLDVLELAGEAADEPPAPFPPPPP